jgi:hypothetical protein
MDAIYEATGNYNEETVDKIAKYWIPDNLRKFVFTALALLLLAAIFFFIFKGYIIGSTQKH